MKTKLSLFAAAVLCASSTLATAQQVTTTTVKETTSSGTITEYAPGGQAIIVRQESSTSPTSYAVTERTTFIDESGAPVVAERVTSGTPITVHYVREGDRMIASRVVVRRAVSDSPTAVVTQRPSVTTTTTGAGTITQFTPGSRMIIRGETAEPLNYAVSSSTTYVDEAGTPIAVENISPGVPVTVHYVREGDHMVASRVVVTRAAPVVPATTTTRQTTTTTKSKDDDDDDNG
jgi:hypothetical protein